MADIDLKTETPDTTLPATGFLFGADSQASASPSVYSTQAVATTLLGSTTLSGTTITADAPVLNLTQTWNNAAVTFTGAKLNITDTASNAASLLMDLQVGGTSKASISKTGSAMFGGTALSIGSANNTLVLYNAALFSWSSSGGVSNNAAVGDTILSRRGAANLRLGAADTTGTTAPTPQFLSAQSWASSTTNNQTGANFTIDGSQGTGTGAGGSIIFRVAPAGVTANGVQNGLVAALTINSAQQVSIQSAGTAAAPTLVWSADTTTGFYKSTGNILDFSAGGVQAMRFSSNGFFFTTSAGKMVVSSAGTFAFSSGTAGAAGEDVLLNRDAANTLALRNGTAAQTFNVYNTFTDASNYSRLSFQGTTGAGGFGITSQAAGTGSLFAIRLIVAGNQNIYFDTNSTTRLFVDYLGHVGTGTDNTTDLGETTLGTRRFRNIYAATSITPGRGVTVATLPTPTTGMIARVTDATAPVIGATVTGGGAAYALVNYNGANWTVIGV